MMQVDNTTPIILNHEKSVTLGILGMTGLWQFTKPSPGVDALCSAAASKKTLKLDYSRFRNGCLIQQLAAECDWRRYRQSLVKR
jgi:hypothetical protein